METGGAGEGEVESACVEFEKLGVMAGVTLGCGLGELCRLVIVSTLAKTWNGSGPEGSLLDLDSVLALDPGDDSTVDFTGLSDSFAARFAAGLAAV
jgi:hypothetical protein